MSPAEAPAPHAARLTLDLGAVAQNWGLLAACAAPAACGAVVKADAYGFGLEPVVLALAAAGCTSFFVAHVGEAERLRRVLPSAMVHVLNGLPEGAAEACHRIGARPVLGSIEEVEDWRRVSGGAPAAFHVDTGMNRLGFPPEAFAAFVEGGGLGAVAEPLVMTHLVAAEVPDDPVNGAQIAMFHPLAERAAAMGARVSLLNSSGHWLPGAPRYDETRPGYALYGGNPTPGRPNPMRLAVRLEAVIVQTRAVPAGAAVGYNGRWRAQRPSRLATVSLGYADGIPRQGGGTDGRAGAVAMVGGTPCPFVGTLSMDLGILDVTDAPPEAARRGGTAVVLGDGLDLEQLGAGCGTIGYEILTNLGRRHQRHYIG